MRCKRLSSDTDALIPAIIGAAILGGFLFGGSYLLTGEDPVTAFKELTIVLTVGCLLFVLGIYLLSGRLVLIPTPYSMVLGIACVIAGPVIIWRGM